MLKKKGLLAPNRLIVVVILVKFFPVGIKAMPQHYQTTQQDTSLPEPVLLPLVDTTDQSVHPADTTVTHVSDTIIPIKLTAKPTVEKPLTLVKIPLADKATHTPVISPSPIKKVKAVESWNSPEKLIVDLFNNPYESEAYRSFSLEKMEKVAEDKTLGLTWREREGGTPDWIFWFFVLGGALFVWVQLFYFKYLGRLFGSVFSLRMASKLMEEGNVLSRRVSHVLNFAYSLALSMLVYLLIQVIYPLHFEIDGFILFLLLLNFVILVSVFKTLLHKLTGYIFESLPVVNHYIHNNYIYNKVMGLLLLPLLVCSVYAPQPFQRALLVICTVIFFLSLLLRFIRGIQLIIKHSIFIFYSFLYLCMLEFLPAIIGLYFIKALI